MVTNRARYSSRRRLVQDSSRISPERRELLPEIAHRNHRFHTSHATTRFVIFYPIITCNIPWERRSHRAAQVCVRGESQAHKPPPTINGIHVAPSAEIKAAFPPRIWQASTNPMTAANAAIHSAMLVT